MICLLELVLRSEGGFWKKSYDKIYVGTCIMIYSNLSVTSITGGNGIFCQSINQNIVAFEILI